MKNQISLAELTSRENILMESLGNPGFRSNEYFERSFEEYSSIHRAYVELFVQNDDIEALKRAVFIQWYSTMEPQFLSGIKQIDEQSANTAMDEVRRLVITEIIDEEFLWMLVCYYQISNRFLYPPERYYEVIRKIDSLPPWKAETGYKFVFTNRGQMGRYWQSRC
jgi:hypothetical protein